jgi:hypothetical protein
MIPPGGLNPSFPLSNFIFVFLLLIAFSPLLINASHNRINITAMFSFSPSINIFRKRRLQIWAMGEGKIWQL